MKLFHPLGLKTLPVLAALVILAGCARDGGADNPVADWAPVSTQTTGRYVRVCVPQRLPAPATAAVAPSPLAKAISPLAPTGPGFDLRTDDKTLQVALSRWASAAGETLRWESAIQVPVTADSHVAGDFPAAMASISQALKQGGYPLTVLGVVGGNTWIITDANDTNSQPVAAASISDTTVVAVQKGKTGKGESHASVR